MSRYKVVLACHFGRLSVFLALALIFKFKMPTSDAFVNPDPENHFGQKYGTDPNKIVSNVKTV